MDVAQNPASLAGWHVRVAEKRAKWQESMPSKRGERAKWHRTMPNGTKQRQTH